MSPSNANDEGLESLVAVAVAGVSPSNANDEGLQSLVVSKYMYRIDLITLKF